MKLWSETGVDWNRIETLLPELEELYGCEQDPRWHAEGNVGFHTRASLNALFHLGGWQVLPEPDKTVVFLATLLHADKSKCCGVLG